MHQILIAALFILLCACTHTETKDQTLESTQLDFDDYSIGLDEDFDTTIYKEGKNHRYSRAFESAPKPNSDSKNRTKPNN